MLSKAFCIPSSFKDIKRYCLPLSSDIFMGAVLYWHIRSITTTTTTSGFVSGENIQSLRQDEARAESPGEKWQSSDPGLWLSYVVIISLLLSFSPNSGCPGRGKFGDSVSQSFINLQKIFLQENFAKPKSQAEQKVDVAEQNIWRRLWKHV